MDALWGASQRLLNFDMCRFVIAGLGELEGWEIPIVTDSRSVYARVI